MSIDGNIRAHVEADFLRRGPGFRGPFGKFGLRRRVQRLGVKGLGYRLQDQQIRVFGSILPTRPSPTKTDTLPKLQPTILHRSQSPTPAQNPPFANPLGRKSEPYNPKQ